MSKVRIGFVGVGGMGQCAHLKNYMTLQDRCEVVAIAEVKRELGRKVAARYDIGHVYETHEEMLAKEKLDGIVASQQFTRHGTLVPELIKSGLPVFTEKPIAGSIENGERILKALAENPKSFLMVGYHKRSDPASRYAKAEIERLVATGELGKMKYIRMIMPSGDWIASGFNDLVHSSDPNPSLAWDAPASDMDKATNALYISFVNYYIHQVNLLRFFLGESYKVSYADPAGVLMVGHSVSGVPVSLEMTPYQTTIDWQESALVCFERGWVKVELPAPLASNRPGRVEVFRDPGNGAVPQTVVPQTVVPQTVVPQMPWVHAMRQQAMNFIGAINGEGRPPCEGAEALEDLKVAREYIRLWKGK